MALPANHPTVPRNAWRILLVGDADHEEFSPTRDWLQSRALWQRVDTLGDVVDLIESGEVPQILILAKLRPGQFSAIQLDRIRSMAPLVRILVVRGAWCEGETCSGQPLRGTWRLSWHQSAQRLEAEWFRYLQGLSPVWELPITAGEDDLAMRPPLQWAMRSSVMVEIVGSDSLLADGYAAECRSFGLSTRRRDPRDLPREALFAARRADLYLCLLAGHRDFSVLHALNRPEQRVPIVAVLGFPRWRDHVAACQSGASAVVSLPTAPDVLQVAIATVLPSRLRLQQQANAA